MRWLGLLFLCASCTDPTVEIQTDGTRPSNEGGLPITTFPMRCNPLSSTGIDPALTRVVTDPVSAPRGGAWEDGTYVLRRADVHEALAVTSGTTMIELRGATAQRVDRPSSEAHDYVATETWTTNGTAVTIARTCPIPQPAVTHPYTFEHASDAPARLTLFVDDVEFVYEKRP